MNAKRILRSDIELKLKLALWLCRNLGSGKNNKYKKFCVYWLHTDR